MNRLLTEGRQAFLRRVSGIERGVECARYEGLLSALADGEASAEQLATLRPHMRTCLSCPADATPDPAPAPPPTAEPEPPPPDPANEFTPGASAPVAAESPAAAARPQPAGGEFTSGGGSGAQAGGGAGEFAP